jgi:hypothetical protein
MAPPQRASQGLQKGPSDEWLSINPFVQERERIREGLSNAIMGIRSHIKESREAVEAIEARRLTRNKQRSTREEQRSTREKKSDDDARLEQEARDILSRPLPEPDISNLEPLKGLRNLIAEVRIDMERIARERNERAAAKQKRTHRVSLPPDEPDRKRRQLEGTVREPQPREGRDTYGALGSSQTVFNSQDMQRSCTLQPSSPTPMGNYSVLKFVCLLTYFRKSLCEPSSLSDRGIAPFGTVRASRSCTAKAD